MKDNMHSILYLHVKFLWSYVKKNQTIILHFQENFTSKV